MTEEYYKIEECVLSSLILRPELMEGLDLDDKYFVKFRRLWIFMKTFYEKFKCFDIEIMKSVCTNQSSLVRYVSKVMESDARYVRFDLYVTRLKEMFEEDKNEVAKIEVIYKLANQLYNRNLKLKDFVEKINTITK